MQRSRGVRVGIALAVLVSAGIAGCRRAAAVSPATGAPRIVSVTNRTGDGSSFHVSYAWEAGGEHRELEVRIDPGISTSYYSSTTTIAVVPPDQPLQRRDGFYVRDALVQIDAGTLRIGSAAFGSVAEARDVFVRTDGVYVDGERRGDLP